MTNMRSIYMFGQILIGLPLQVRHCCNHLLQGAGGEGCKLEVGQHWIFDYLSVVDYADAEI